ncbi:proline iminopeptidase [Rhodococcus sp. AG1013]|uniref:prolyl aminopeptidase n=1 Tax=Rhodococcus sp. AG1013 TaxID=2183996 RepID=UPI000E2C75DE|nr:prolyl aminopeptidase [Rhodococcus sp. AG1013]RDI33651.1 proline iminopeptidase [Rhodococcus sp. AG1013]
MTALYPRIEPYVHGMLEVGDGNRIYWECCGNPDGIPAVVLHGGPGSGCAPGWRRFFDPSAYRIVLFDQRGCGRSLPHASDPATSLHGNTTQHLIADIERLRTHLGIDRWLVFGWSWGSTLGLTYAQSHPGHVRGIVLGAVATTSHTEVEWVTRGVGVHFPEQWARYRDGVPAEWRDSDLAAAYSRLLESSDPAVREQAARDWCAWEDAHVRVRPEHRADPRYDDPTFRMCFARLVTHYWSNAAFLPDGQILRDAHRLHGIPGVLVHGMRDISCPADSVRALAAAWPDAELHLVDEAGHFSGDPGMTDLAVAGTDRFARAHTYADPLQ